MGICQADRYDEFLQEFMQTLADEPGNAPFLPNLRQKVKVSVARWNNTRYGHRVFFREIPGGIEVLGILHTSMQWEDHLDLA